jgi:hypothetical protein
MPTQKSNTPASISGDSSCRTAPLRAASGREVGAGGAAFQTSTIVLKDAIYIPVPQAIEGSFIPVASERKRFEIRADLLRVDGRMTQ